VDDDPGIVEVLVSILGSLGYSVDSVSNGKDAIEKWRKSKPDVIVMDFIMPVMNGIDAANVIRKDDAAVKLIFHSAVADTTTLKELERMSSTFLKKPCTVADIVEAIEGD